MTATDSPEAPDLLAAFEHIDPLTAMVFARMWQASQDFCDQMDLLTTQVAATPEEVERLRSAVSRMGASIGPPPLAIDGHAYRRRQKNRVRRRKR